MQLSTDAMNETDVADELSTRRTKIENKFAYLVANSAERDRIQVQRHTAHSWTLQYNVI